MPARIVFLAGPAGAGKTVTCSSGSMISYWRCVETEPAFRECYHISEPWMRQLCFYEKMNSIAIKSIAMIARNPYRKPIVVDNAPLSVHAYTEAIAARTSDPLGHKMLTAVAKMSMELQEQAGIVARTVLLIARPDKLEDRIRRRLMSEKERNNNPVELDMDLHIHAMEIMKTAAINLGIEIVDTSDIYVADTIKKVRQILYG